MHVNMIIIMIGVFYHHHRFIAIAKFFKIIVVMSFWTWCVFMFWSFSIQGCYSMLI